MQNHMQCRHMCMCVFGGDAWCVGRFGLHALCLDLKIGQEFIVHHHHFSPVHRNKRHHLAECIIQMLRMRNTRTLIRHHKPDHHLLLNIIVVAFWSQLIVWICSRPLLKYYEVDLAIAMTVVI